MRIASWLRATLANLFLGLLLTGLWGSAMAQQEPTLNQIYATAQAGQLDQAQVMVQQVLISHPKSAKAHFVHSELLARQGKMAQAREALAQAHALAPGLPFAKAEAVQALEKQLAMPAAAPTPVAQAPAPIHSPAAAAPAERGNWVLPALLAAGVLAGAYFIFRRKAAPAPAPVQPAYDAGLRGPQTFGSAVQQPAYGNGGYPAYGQPAPQPGLGGRIMGGVATGLAVGAGVVAAEAIGRSLMGDHAGHNAQAAPLDTSAYEPLPQSAVNTDMGGANFGVADGGWDDGGASDGGGDWDQ